MDNVLIWDLPTRIGHWMLVVLFVLSYLTGDSESWRLVHVVAGSAMGGVLIFRVFWGVAGTRFARFSSFLFAPRQVYAYLAALVQRKPIYWMGHNPAGGYSIIVMLSLGLAVVGSGLAVYFEVGGDSLERAHDVLSYSMLYVVGVHLLGVIVSSRMHQANLVRSMIDGHKQGRRKRSRGEVPVGSTEIYWVFLLVGCAVTAGLLVMYI